MLNNFNANILTTESTTVIPTGILKITLTYEAQTATLFVTIHNARNLNTRVDGSYPNPFVKIYLLPGRRVENKRRTKFMTETVDPDWQQTVVYKEVLPDQIQRDCIEFTVWDYDKFGQNLFLGQVTLSLGETSQHFGAQLSFRLQQRGSTNVVAAQESSTQPVNEYYNYNYRDADAINANYYNDNPVGVY